MYVYDILSYVNRLSVRAGETFWLHDVKRELYHGVADVGSGTELHETLRARMHRDRRTHETILMHVVLHVLTLQLWVRSGNISPQHYCVVPFLNGPITLIIKHIEFNVKITITHTFNEVCSIK